MNKLIASVLLSALCTQGCATIIKGSRQMIYVNSDPPGSQVKIDSRRVGNTPYSGYVTHDEHVISVSHDRCETQDHLITTSISGWTFFPILFAGIGLVPSIVVDGINGTITTLDEDIVDVYLSCLPPEAVSKGTVTYSDSED